MNGENKMNETERSVLGLYGDGRTVKEISNQIGIGEQLVYQYLRINGVNQRKQCASVSRQFGIGSRRINQVRRTTREGSRIRVRSVKASMYGDFEGKIKKGSIPKVPAKVLSTASKYFCLVELPGGTLESILWIDLVGENLERY